MPPSGTSAVPSLPLPSAIVADLAAMDRLTARRLRSEVALVNTVADYIVGSGGKRLRPTMLLLSARALGYGSRPEHSQAHHVLLAAVVEFIHTATLLHDDVVDESALRSATPPRCWSATSCTRGHSS
jgi:octaprenyl-diphosphate synthase